MNSNVRVGFEVQLREQKFDEIAGARVVPVRVQPGLELTEILTDNLSVDVDAEAVGEVVPDRRLVDRRSDAVLGRQFADDACVRGVSNGCLRFFYRAVTY